MLKQHTLGTKAYWLVNDITTFPKCKRKECQNVLTKNAIVTTGYGAGYCSISCEMNDSVHAQQLEEIFMDRYGAKSYPESEEFNIMIRNYFANLTDNEKIEINNKKETTCFKNNGVRNIFCKGPRRTQWEDELEKRTGSRTWHNPEKIVQTRQKHNEEDPLFQVRINQKTAATRNKRKKEDPQYQERIVQKGQATRELHRKENPNYDAEILQKTMATNIANTGYAWPSQNPEIRSKMYKKYTYNGIQFDSAPEIAYYIWLTDNGIPFEYHPQTNFSFLGKDGKIHYYEPDFLRLDTNTYEEIKGGQFFKTGFIERWKEKLACLKANNVRLILDTEYNIYVEYCDQKFQKRGWHLEFKNY